MRIRRRGPIWLAMFACLAPALPALAEDHEARFEISRAFLEAWAHNPARDVEVNLFCDDASSSVAGPVHNEDSDCELHVGSLLANPATSDFQGVVLEPPNVCAESGTNWRTTINSHENEDCTARGFVRAWPEHLTSGSGCSNPDHFMEIHPLQTLKCGQAQVLDFTSKLRAVPGLGYKDVATVKKMLDFRLWVCQGCGGNPIESGVVPLEFDYCFGKSCTHQQASNFARFHIRPLRETIRTKTANSLDGLASAIVRAVPVSKKGKASTSQFRFLKVYALEGSAFYDKLLQVRDGTGSIPTLDVIGVFTMDPFSVLRVIEKPGFAASEWASVPFPVALVAFGEVE